MHCRVILKEKMKSDDEENDNVERQKSWIKIKRC